MFAQGSRDPLPTRRLSHPSVEHSLENSIFRLLLTKDAKEPSRGRMLKVNRAAEATGTRLFLSEKSQKQNSVERRLAPQGRLLLSLEERRRRRRNSMDFEKNLKLAVRDWTTR